MRIGRMLVALPVAIALLLSACTKPQPSVVQSPPAPAQPAQTPPPQSPAPDPSPVTWEIIHTASGLKAPGGSLYLAPPYRFELTFSAPVDRASVEAALTKNAAEGKVTVAEWSSDRRAVVDVAPPAPGSKPFAMGAVDPSGGKDPEGRPLAMPWRRVNAGAFTFWPAPVTQVTSLDPRTGKIAVVLRHPEPLQTVSVSPDGHRHLLRQHILTPGQSVGTTGDAYLLDVQTGAVAALGVGHLFRYEWSTDDGVLVSGRCEQGPSCAVWLPAGAVQARAGSMFTHPGRLLYQAGPDEGVTTSTLSPSGRCAAVFAGQYHGPQALHLFNQAGKEIRVIPAAAGLTYGPSGMTWVPTAWAPDGSLLAYGDGGTGREEGQPMKVWLLNPTGGKPRLLTDKASDIGPWSPKGDRLFLPNVGVVDRTGKVVLAERQGPVAWSPDGKRLYVQGAVYDTATWQKLWVTPGGAGFWTPDSQSIVLAGSGASSGGGGGLYRADGTQVTGPYLFYLNGVQPQPLFSRNGRFVYLPGPDRVVQVATGKVYPVKLNEPDAQEPVKTRPIGFTDDGKLLLAPGYEWEQ